jgi:hypothetical protein
MQLFLEDSTGSVLQNDHLPVTPPSLNSFDIGDFHLFDQLTNDQVQLDAEVTSLTDPASPVPEPSPAMLLLGAAVVVVIVSKRRPVSASR